MWTHCSGTYIYTCSVIGFDAFTKVFSWNCHLVATFGVLERLVQKVYIHPRETKLFGLRQQPLVHSLRIRVGLRFKAPHMHRMGMEVWGRVNKCKQDRKLHLHSLTTIFNDFTVLHPSSFWGLLCKIFGWWSGFSVSIQALWARAHMGKPWHWTIAGTEPSQRSSRSVSFSRSDFEFKRFEGITRFW